MFELSANDLSANNITPDRIVSMATHTSFQLGTSTLNVLSLSRMEQYYRDIIGLEILERNSSMAILGHNKNPILILKYEPNLPFSHPLSAGLYHNAIVFASREHLATTLHKILEKFPNTFTGSADHLVSEAFYFTDPEGNGLELYFDRDPSTWGWQDGRVKMASIYLDPTEYIRRYASPSEIKEKHLGHVHLKVGSIEQAKHFYVSVLRFDITAEFQSALFVSKDGYHHHLGMNTWESYGAGPRENSLGLQEFEMKFTQKKDLELLEDSLVNNDIEFKKDKNRLIIHDPWNNGIIVCL